MKLQNKVEVTRISYQTFIRLDHDMAKWKEYELTDKQLHNVRGLIDVCPSISVVQHLLTEDGLVAISKQTHMALYLPLS